MFRRVSYGVLLTCTNHICWLFSHALLYPWYCKSQRNSPHAFPCLFFRRQNPGSWFLSCDHTVGCVFSLVCLYAVPAKIYLLLLSHRSHNHFSNICQILVHTFTKQFLSAFIQSICICLPLNFREQPGQSQS